MKTQYQTMQRGFALLEALVSMLVLSFGMLAVAGFQTTLSLNSDVAKQRTEATRLAQQKMEQLRAFDSLSAYSTNMVSSSSSSPVTQETITTNTSFIRSWGITSANTIDTGRSVVVTVAWTDRAGAAQQVQLFSHVSATSPVLNGALLFPLIDGTILRQPKNRNIDIPIPAIAISNTNKSYIRWSGTSGGYLVFNNDSGDVVQKCTVEPTASTVSTASTASTASTVITASTTSTVSSLTTDVCTTFDGYLLTGYITANNTTNLTLATKIVVPFSNAQHITGTPECSVGSASDQASGTVIADTKYYACLITPSDHDSNNNTARVWTGRVDVAGSAVGNLIGTKTCRFTTNAATTNNNLHPAIYSLVDRSLDNQNFYITSIAGSCGTGSILHLTNTLLVP